MNRVLRVVGIVAIAAILMNCSGEDSQSSCQFTGDPIWSAEGFGFQLYLPQTCPASLRDTNPVVVPYSGTVSAPLDVEATFPLEFYSSQGSLISDLAGFFTDNGDNTASANVSSEYSAGTGGVTGGNTDSDYAYNYVTAGDGETGTGETELPHEIVSYEFVSPSGQYSVGQVATFKILNGRRTSYEYFQDGVSLAGC